LSATPLSSLTTPELLLTPAVPASVNSVISAASALIPSPSSDFQPLTFDFQPPLRCYPPACPNPVEALVRKSSPHLAISLPPYFLFSKSFICNTYASPRKCCKQKTYGLAKPFRCNTYKKHGGGAAIMVNQALETSRPTSSHPLCLRTSVVSSAFRLPYTLPSSVSRNPFVCHSYENCRGVYQQFPFWNVLSDWRHHFAVSLPSYFLTSLRPYFFTSRSSLFRQTTAARFPARWLLSERSPCQ
jgi:hypothetical protein